MKRFIYSVLKLPVLTIQHFLQYNGGFSGVGAGRGAWSEWGDKIVSFYSRSITKTYLYNFDPLKPHSYKVKLGFTGVYTIFLITAQNIDCGYSLEPSRRGGYNEYPRSMFWAEICKISEFLSEKFQFLEVKFSIYLNRRVFVMPFQKGVKPILPPLNTVYHINPK